MTAHASRQYRPISQLETAADAALSVPTFTRMADNINNWQGWVGNYPQVHIWPADGSQLTEVVSAGTGNEEFILYFGRIYLDKAYTKLRVYLQGRVTGAGSSTWTVHASTNLYTDDPDNFNREFLIKDSDVSLDFTTTAWAIATDTLSIPWRAMDGTICLCLSAQDTAGVPSTLISATLQPDIS